MMGAAALAEPPGGAFRLSDRAGGMALANTFAKISGSLSQLRILSQSLNCMLCAEGGGFAQRGVWSHESSIRNAMPLYRCMAVATRVWTLVVISDLQGFLALRRPSPTLRGVYSDYTLIDAHAHTRHAQLTTRHTALINRCYPYIHRTAALMKLCQN